MSGWHEHQVARPHDRCLSRVVHLHRTATFDHQHHVLVRAGLRFLGASCVLRPIPSRLVDGPADRDTADLVYLEEPFLELPPFTLAPFEMLDDEISVHE